MWSDDDEGMLGGLFDRQGFMMSDEGQDDRTDAHDSREKTPTPGKQHRINMYLYASTGVKICSNIALL